jgi:acetyltransferase
MGKNLSSVKESTLDKFFHPKSVAVVGASRDPRKLGYVVLDNLLRSRFPGRIFPINPQAEQILGLKVYPSITKVRARVDLAVIVVPAAATLTVLEECGEKDIEAAVVLSAGFREIGDEGRRLEDELVGIAKRHNIRLVGPNSLGVIDTFASLNASFSESMPDRWEIGVMSQSGAMATAILDWANMREVGFSTFVSLGNMADVNEVDLLEYYYGDDECHMLVAYLEGISDGERFVKAAQRFTKKKPLVVMKVGTTQTGATAANSHTGALAVAEEAVAAALRQAGVVRANTMEELFDFTMGFAGAPLPKGKSMAIVTNAGGPGVMTSDAVERSGLLLEELSPGTQRALRRALPPASNVRNPVDILGDAPASSYQRALEAVLEDPGIHGVFVLLTPQATTEPEATARIITGLAKRYDKPVMASFMGGVAVLRGRDILEAARVPSYAFPERAVRTMAALEEYNRYLNRDETPPPEFQVDRRQAESIIAGVRKRNVKYITGGEADRIFAAYGFNTLPSRVCTSVEEAAEYARSLGFPVVAKVVSDDILHKSDVGGVKIGLRDADAVVAAYHDILRRIGKARPEARLDGVLIEPQIEGGKEVILGLKCDPRFGPLIMFGLGGIYVEVLKDVSFRVVPLSPNEAREMITELRNYPLLTGVRGEPPVDIEAIVDALLRLSRLSVDFPEIEEVDVNPMNIFSEC